MKKFKIVRYKGLGNWFVYRRYLIFFWGQKNYFMTLEDALKYVRNKTVKIIDEQE